MKKTLLISGIAVVIISVIVIIVSILNPNKNPSSEEDNKKAEKDTEHRYLTIVNKTEVIINHIYITVGNGSKVASRENPDDTNIIIQIPDEFKKYSDFTITLIDRYDLKYEKNISNVPETGRTEVTVSQDNYVKQKGDWWKKINKAFNKD